jgi:hypothetical protein
MTRPPGLVGGNASALVKGLLRTSNKLLNTYIDISEYSQSGATGQPRAASDRLDSGAYRIMRRPFR